MLDTAIAAEWIMPALRGVAPLLACPPGLDAAAMRGKGASELAATRDNAASCLARLIGRLADMPEAARPVPLPSVLGEALGPFCEVLPLCADREEERPVYSFLARLLASEPPMVPQASTAVVLACIARVISPGGVEEIGLAQGIASAAASFGAKVDPATMSAALAAVGEAERAVLKEKFGW
jgi:hypothetical protein